MSSASFWYILGDAYDLSDFKHPGGQAALQWSRGQDATFVMLSYHLANPKSLLQRLEPFKVDNLKRWDPFIAKIGKRRYETQEDRELILNDPVLKIAKACVVESGQAACQITSQAFVFVVVMALCSILAAFLVQWQRSILASILWPIFHWLSAANIAHDAAHHAAFRHHENLNTFWSYWSLPFLFEPRSWQRQHNFSHHLHTNDLDLDVDTNYGPLTTLARIDTDQKWFSHMPLTWSLFLFSQIFLTSFAEVVFMPLTKLHGTRSLIGPFSGCLVFLVPWVLRVETEAWTRTACLSCIPSIVASLIFIVVTQASHLSHQQLQVAQGPKGILAPGEWGRCQALASLNYQPNSLLYTALTGGLNLQSVHHLLPFVHSWRLHKIWPLLQRRLKALGIDLPEAPSLCCAFSSYVQQLKLSSSNRS